MVNLLFHFTASCFALIKLVKNKHQVTKAIVQDKDSK